VIHAVLFDLDGTLYDRDAAISAVVRDQYAVFKDRLRAVEPEVFLDRFLAFDEYGYAPRDEVYRRLAAELGLGAKLAADLALHFWESYGRHCEVSDDTWATLRTLRSLGKTLGVVTNGETRWQMTKLERLGMGGFFDVVLVSEAEGIRKPDARIFHRALDRCGATPADAMFVGDHPEIDVAGAKAAGLVPVWKRVPYWTLTSDDVLVVDRLSEILAVIR